MTRSRWMQRSHPGPRLRFFYGEQHSLQLCGTAPSSDTGLGSFLCARRAPWYPAWACSRCGVRCLTLGTEAGTTCSGCLLRLGLAHSHRQACRRVGAQAGLAHRAPQPRPRRAAEPGQDDDCAEHRPAGSRRRPHRAFTTASQLLLDLGAQDSPRALDRRLKHYARASLLVVDEVGYLSCDARNADLLFQGSGEETQNVCAGCGELLPGAGEPRRRWAPQVPLESPSGRRARVPGSARGEREGAQSRGRWPGA